MRLSSHLKIHDADALTSGRVVAQCGLAAAGLGLADETNALHELLPSERGGLGFLADARRVNVAFTRARVGLIVIGHPPTLQREPGTWAPWLAWARAHGLVMGEAPSGRYDAHATRASSASAGSSPGHSFASAQSTSGV